MTPHVERPRPWEDCNPLVCGLLAFLIPGAGHFVQGRTLKAAINFFCILGLFFWGLRLGDWVVVYNMPDKAARGLTSRVALGYAAQFGVGLGALPALLQNQRAKDGSNAVTFNVTQPLTAEFQGKLTSADRAKAGVAIGSIRVEPTRNEFGNGFKGTFQGTIDGESVTLDLGGQFELDRPIKAGFRRELQCGVVGREGLESQVGVLKGSIPRPLLNAYASPPDPVQIQELHERLGKSYELALVFTYIAGLLNVLAIWDCLCGPAYGFGDEKWEEPSDEKQKGDAKS